MNKKIIISLFLIALALRLFLIPNRGFEADVAFWKSWGLSALDNGVVEGIAVTNNNYPTPFSYFLALMAFVYRLFANPHNFDSYWNSGNVLFLLIAKLPSILADLGIAGIILWIGSKSTQKHPESMGDTSEGSRKRPESRNCNEYPELTKKDGSVVSRLASSIFGARDEDLCGKREWQAPYVQIFPNLPFSFYILCAALYLFNPISLIDGALWGQVDSVGVFVFLIAILCAAWDKPFLGGAVFMLSMMTKLQNMIYGPLFFLLLWQLGSYKGLIKGIAGAISGFLFLNMEFLLKKNAGAVWESLTSNYDYFPMMSLNAFNLWWIVAKGAGMQMSDKFLSVGLLNAKTTGLILFSTGYLLAALTMAKETLGRMWKSSVVSHQSSDNYRKNEEMESTKVIRQQNTLDILYRFFTALIIVAFCFFLFQTESHDRYAFPVSVFFLLWGIFYVFRTNTEKNRIVFWKTRSFQIFIIGYIVFSALFFLNLHTALSYNYPFNSIPALHFLGAPLFTIPLSILQIAFFFFFLYVVRKSIGTSVFFLCFFISLSLYLFPNLPLLTKTPVSLTKLTPVISQQGYGRTRTDMPVTVETDASKNWNRLSVQYSFYKKGIGTHASSYIVYDTNGLFKRFTSDIGIDTQAGSKGSVVFKVYGNDKLLYQSDIIKRYEYPRHLDIDITGVKKFALIVDDAGDGINDDHADWLRPTLWP